MYFTSSCNRKVEVEKVEKKYIEELRDSRVKGEREQKCDREEKSKKEGKVYI